MLFIEIALANAVAIVSAEGNDLGDEIGRTFDGPSVEIESVPGDEGHIGLHHAVG